MLITPCACCRFLAPGTRTDENHHQTIMSRIDIGLASLYLGNSLDLMPSFNSIGIGTVITDPPYGISFRSNYRSRQHERIINDESTCVALEGIHLARSIAMHSVYVFGRWNNVADYPRPKSLITWIKNNWSMGDLRHEHARQTEVCFFYPGPDHRWPGKRPPDVIDARRTKNLHHPTEKPVELMAQILEWTEGIVLDPFMGSGSTGVAAVTLGRQFVGVELDTIHFQTAVRRIAEAQGLKSDYEPTP